MDELAARDRARARTLAGAIEPVAGQAQFSPECHSAYAALGFGEGLSRDAYFSARGSVFGLAPAEVIAAAFAVFNPESVISGIDRGRTLAEPETMRVAREEGAVAQLRRVLGSEPEGVTRAAALLSDATVTLPIEGRPFFAAQRAVPLPDDPLHRMWRAGEILREFRGDSHTIAWVSAGLDPIEEGLLSDLFWGLPLRSHTLTRGWSPEQIDAAIERLRARALIGDDDLTEAGFELREEIEVATDAQVRPAITALGDAFDELIGIVQPWGDQLISEGAYTHIVRFTRPANRAS